MDIATAQRLNDLTSTFYQEVEASFSATRQAPWQGWERVCTHAKETLREPLRVLDLACGNLRFERYLATRFNDVRVWAADNCDALAQEASSTPAPPTQDPPDALTQDPPDAPPSAPQHIAFQHIDLIQTLLDGHDLSARLDAPPCDLAVCFGFMHHVALPDHRFRVLQTLVDHTRPGGLVALSFWQFARSPRILAKAQPLADKGDYLLGWQNRTDVCRYCHSFEDEEVDALIASLGPRAQEVARFWDDGKHRNLNRYTILHIT